MKNLLLATFALYLIVGSGINKIKAQIMDELNGSTLGTPYGITYTATPNGQGAVFLRTNESRIEYPFLNGLPHQGTIEMLIKVTQGYGYSNYTLYDNQTSASIFTTGPSDVWYLGAMWLNVNDTGGISLTTALTATPTSHTLSAPGTAFRFNEWHVVSFSYGSQGQYIKVDGQLVASNSSYTETLQACGDWGSNRVEPTVGEFLSVFWANNQYESGFEGTLDRFRASTTQQDWVLNVVNCNDTTVYNNLSITVCDSVLLGGSYQHTTGIYYDSLQTVNGNCDSIRITNLDVINPFPYTDTIPVYDTTSITVYDTTTVFDTTNVTVYDTSIVTINDTVLTNIYDTIPVYDTVTVTDTVQVYDSTFVTVTDTVIVTDTNTVTVYDTTMVYDTTVVTVTDTNYVTDTTYVTIYDSISVTDTLIIDVNTGLNPPNNVNTVKVFPNPSKTHIYIDNGNFALLSGYKIAIENSLGQQVFFSLINQQQFFVDLSGWTGNGLYFVHIIDPQNNTIDIRKIILQ